MPILLRRVFPVALFSSILMMSCAPREGTFRHEGHVVIVKGACSPCHGGDPANPRPASTGDCAACHPQAADPSNAGRYGLTDRPRTRRPITYKDIVFSHASHAASGISCAACHGGKEGPGFPSMPGCAACHEKEGAPTSCLACHKKLPADVPASRRPVR
ncbi:MAG: cytochrome c3 family protein [bacterium]